MERQIFVRVQIPRTVNQKPKLVNISLCTPAPIEGRWLDEWTNTLMDGRTDWYIEEWTDELKERNMNGWIYRRMDKRMDGWRDGWLDGWLDGGWVDRLIDRRINGWKVNERMLMADFFTSVLLCTSVEFWSMVIKSASIHPIKHPGQTTLTCLMFEELCARDFLIINLSGKFP